MEFELALEKLGEAIYIHKKNIERAELAKQAVEYLDSKGVFADDLHPHDNVR